FIPVTVQPNYGTSFPDVAGEQLTGDAAAVLPAASADLKAWCQAICGVAQATMQQQQGQSFDQPPQQLQFELMRMTLQTLPSICNVYIPEYCTAAPCSRITPSPYSMPMAATCAGGACC
uniref:Uncharacterized protein n=1 Tax=Avena sativa TaxID=4498 RepID=A0ACD5XWI3_AVESA